MIFILLVLICNILLYTANGAVPDKPNTPTLSSISGSSLTIEWSEPNSNGAIISGYKVRISPDSNMIFAYLLPDQSDSLNRTLELLDPGTDYYADVLATSNEGDSPRSDLAGPFQTLKNKPDKPNSPIFVSKTSFTVTLKYTALAANDLALDGAVVTGYRILASKNNAMTDPIATDDTYTNIANTPEERQLTISNLDANTDYYFTLIYLISDTILEENSDPSDPTSAIKTLGYPIKPTKPTVNTTETTATSLTVNFIATSPNGATITGYEVRIASSTSGPWTSHGTTDPNNFIRKFTNLLANTQYYFDVIAIVDPVTGTNSESSDPSDPYKTKARPNKCDPPRQSRIATMRTQTTLGFDIQTTLAAGANIYGYRVRLRDISNVLVSSQDITDPYQSIKFTSLTSNTGYKASVKAIVVDSNIDQDSVWSDDSEIIYTINPALSNSFATGPSVPALPPDIQISNDKLRQGITPDQVTFDFHSLNNGNLWVTVLTIDQNPNIAFIKAGTNSLCTPIQNFATTALSLHQLVLESCILNVGQKYKLYAYIETSNTDGEIRHREFSVSPNFITKIPFRVFDGNSLFVTYQTSTNTGLSYGMLVRSSRASRVTITDLKRQTFDGSSACGWKDESLVSSGLNNTHDLSSCGDLANEFLSIIIHIEENEINNSTLGFVQHTSPSNELSNMILSLPFSPNFQSNVTSYDLGNVADVNKTFDIKLTFDPLATVKMGKNNEEVLISNEELRNITLSTGPNTIRILVDAANELTVYTISAFLQPASSSFDAAKFQYTIDTSGTEAQFKLEIINVLSSLSVSIVESQIEILSYGGNNVEFLINPPQPDNNLNAWSGENVRQKLSNAAPFSSTILSTISATLIDTIVAVDLCAKQLVGGQYVYAAPFNWKLKNQCSASEKLYCFTSPCLNNGQCSIRTSTFVVDCECQKRYFGSYCEAAVGDIVDKSLVLNSTVSGNVTLNSTHTEDIGTRTNDGLLIINGTHVKFKAHLRGGKNIKVYYGQEGNRKRFQCMSPIIYPALDEQTTPTSEEVSNEYWIDCLLKDNFGGNMFFTLEMDDVRDLGTFTVNGPTGYGNNIRYPRPVIIPKTLRIDGSSVNILNNDDFATVTGTSLLGETLVFETKYVKPDAQNVQIKFVQTTGSSIVLCDLIPSESTTTTLKCDLRAGSGADYKFIVDYGQESILSKDEFEYPVPPSITKIEALSVAGGCDSVSNYVENCPTHALDASNDPIVLTITGDKLFDPISITVGGKECKDMTFINTGTKVSCKLPVGAGFRQIISAVSRGLISDPVTLVSYARPSISTISGCTPDTSYIVNKGIKDCNRFGNDIIIINGKNFGPGLPFVLVGSSICKNVQTISQHFSVQCSLPPGKSLSRSVLLVQDAGVVNTDAIAASVSYRQCLPGQYGDGFDCKLCDIGKITSAKSQLECRKCQVGKYQNATGQSTCKSCDIGKYQNLEGQGVCNLCKPGSYNAATGQAVCPTCLGGEFSNTTGFTECYDCPAGSFSLDNATVCTLCTAGTFAPLEKSKECTETPPGQFSDIQGARVAEECPRGQFQPKKNTTTCEDCPLGKYSDERGRELCFDCKDQFYQDEKGQTKCKSCQTDGVYCVPTYVETKANYWLYRTDTGVTAYSCPEGICLGGNRCDDHREPFEVNPMCAHCREKYSEWGGLCTWCDGTHIEFILLYFVQVFLITLLIHLILQPDQHDSRHYTSENVLKIFFYFIQVALLIVGRALPEGLYWLHYFNLNVGKATAAWNVCYAPWDGLQLLTLELFTPAIYWGALAVIMLLHRIIHEYEQRKRIADGRHRKKFRRTPYTLSALSLYLLTYQLVSSAVFRFYDCKTILGDRVVFTVPSVSCNSEEYDGLKFFYALVGIVWVGAIPLLMIAIMIYYTNGKNDIRVNKLVFELVSKKLQLLYGSWHSNAYFWEGVILLRRMLYSGFDVIYSAELEQKFLAFVLISLASLTHHYVIRPPKPAEMKKKRPKLEDLRELRHETHRRRASISEPNEEKDGTTRRKSIFGRRFSGVFVSKARERSVSRDWSNMSGSFASLAMLQMKNAKGDEFVNNLMHLETNDNPEEDSITINDEKDGNTEPGLQEGKLPAWYDDEVAREAQKQELIIQIQRLKKEIRRIEHGGRFEAKMPVRLAVPRIFTKREQFLFGTRVIYLAVERDQLMVRVGGGYRREEDFLAKWAAQEARLLGVSPADVAHAVTKIEHSKAAAEDEVKRKLKKLARGRFMRRHALLERLYQEVDLRERQIDGLDDEKYRQKYREKAEAEAAAERRRRRQERRRKEAEERRIERERRLKELADKEEAFDKEWEDHWRKHRLVGIRAHKSHGPFRRPLENYLETLSLAFLLLLAVLRTAFKPPLPDSMIVMMSFLVMLVAVGLLLLASRRGLAAVYDHLLKRYEEYKEAKNKTGDDIDNVELLKLDTVSSSTPKNVSKKPDNEPQLISLQQQLDAGGEDSKFGSTSELGGIKGEPGNKGGGLFGGVLMQQSTFSSVPEEDEEKVAMRSVEKLQALQEEEEDDDEDDDNVSDSSLPSQLPDIPDNENGTLAAVQQAYSVSESMQKGKKKKKKKKTKSRKKSFQSTNDVSDDQRKETWSNFVDPRVDPSRTDDGSASVTLPAPYDTVHQIDDYIRRLHDTEGQQPLLRLPTELGGSASTALGMKAAQHLQELDAKPKKKSRRASMPTVVHLPHHQFHFQEHPEQTGRMSRRKSSVDSAGSANGSRRNSTDEPISDRIMQLFEQPPKKKKKRKIKRKLRKKRSKFLDDVEYKYGGDYPQETNDGYDSDPDFGEANRQYNDFDDDNDDEIHSDPEIGEPGMPSSKKKKARKFKKKVAKKKKKTKKKKKSTTPRNSIAQNTTLSGDINEGEIRKDKSTDFQRLDTFEALSLPGNQPRQDTFEPLESIMKQPKVIDSDQENEEEEEEELTLEQLTARSKRRIRWDTPSTMNEDEKSAAPVVASTVPTSSANQKPVQTSKSVNKLLEMSSSRFGVSSSTNDVPLSTTTTSSSTNDQTKAKTATTESMTPRRASMVDRLLQMAHDRHENEKKTE